MEVLNLLEERVQQLLDEVVQAREEKRRALEEVGVHIAEVQNLKEENRLLKDALLQERQVKDDVQQRIDSLLERLKVLD